MNVSSHLINERIIKLALRCYTNLTPKKSPREPVKFSRFLCCCTHHVTLLFILGLGPVTLSGSCFFICIGFWRSTSPNLPSLPETTADGTRCSIQWWVELIYRSPNLVSQVGPRWMEPDASRREESRTVTPMKDQLPIIQQSSTSPQEVNCLALEFVCGEKCPQS